MMLRTISQLGWMGMAAALTVSASGCSRHRTPNLAARADALTADALVIAAGDIADCDYKKGEYAQSTADLAKQYPGATVLALGDIAYPNGTRTQLAECYDERWGALKKRTRPAPGNHDYGLRKARDNADPYFEYFGASAGPPGKGYYSFDLGAWHIVSLNSMAGAEDVEASTPSMDEQARWLERDLSRTHAPCILAFWHHPLFSSGHHGHKPDDPGRAVGPLWEALEAHGADVILNGHDHDYERFAPQTIDGVVDRAHGIRQFIVGTGGAELRAFKDKHILPNSEVRIDDEHGVLLLELHSGSYEWRFLTIDGTTGDASNGPVACHPKADD
ncbi:alkaline phosphatase [Minicystis rosea]|nr:alkaline phosphatase [Minicystis rosea]